MDLIQEFPILKDVLESMISDHGWEPLMILNKPKQFFLAQ